MSKLIETRAEFQRLAEERLDEAQVLLAAKKWGGAYYLAGYAVELGLKACIIKVLAGRDKFPEKELSKDCHTHSLKVLLGTARLTSDWQTATATDRTFRSNWGTVADGWSEEMRYYVITPAEARKLLKAVTDPTHGVFPWIRSRW